MQILAAWDGFPLGLGLVVESKPTEFSCECIYINNCTFIQMLALGTMVKVSMMLEWTTYFVREQSVTFMNAPLT